MFLRKDFGFDLGTTYMHICQKEKGVILNEPEVIAINRENNTPIAVGDEAYEMFERSPNAIVINKPVKFGVIADYDNILELLNIQCEHLNIRRNIKSKAIICVPNKVSEVERRALFDVFMNCKAKFNKVYLIEKPLAAAIGCGVDVLQAEGNLIVDIGGGTTEISVVSLGGVVISDLIKIGGEKFDENIQNYVKRKFNVYIGLKSSEKIKKDIGTVLADQMSACSEVYGRDIISGLPKKIQVSGEDVYNAIREDIYIIIDSIKYILEKTPPELSGDILTKGIYISGGTANLTGIGEVISKETGLKVNTVDKPNNAVINGVNHILNKYNKHKAILFTPK